MKLEFCRKKRDKEGSKKALLDAALAVFAERGYDAATTREVAKKAKVSEALIQRYFEGKAGLLLAITQHLMNEGNEEALSSLPFAPTLEEDILQVLNQSCSHLGSQSHFIRVILSRAIVDAKLGHQMGEHVHQRRLPLLKTRLLHYQQKGQISPNQNLHAAAFAISGLTFTLGFMAPEVFAFDRTMLAEIAKSLAGVFARGLA